MVASFDAKSDKHVKHRENKRILVNIVVTVHPFRKFTPYNASLNSQKYQPTGISKL